MWGREGGSWVSVRVAEVVALDAAPVVAPVVAGFVGEGTCRCVECSDQLLRLVQ